MNELENIVDFNVGQLELLYNRLTMYPEIQEDIKNLTAKLREI